MKINLLKAVNQFYGNPSLDLVYFEAIANSLDAKATDIELTIKINSFEEAESFNVFVKDNGVGFDTRGYDRFCTLLETDNTNNKGIGRLIFVNYFNKVEYKTYSKDFQRSFSLDENFEGDFKEINELSSFGTHLSLKDYRLEKINTYDYLKADSLKKAIELHFLPRLFLLKQENKQVKITIKVETKKENIKQDFFSTSAVISTDNLPNLKKATFQANFIDMFHEFELYYLVEKDYQATSLQVAIAVDNRSIDISDIISRNNIPDNYNLIFLIQSEYFNGKTSNSRQKLTIDDNTFKTLKKSIIQQIKGKLEQEIPHLIENNQRKKAYLDKRYPHLTGFFDDDIVGFIDTDKLIEKAQMNFFKEQKKILEADKLNDEQYHKSLEISSRVLMEYILYRNLIIEKLKATNQANSEAEIHEMIVPMKQAFTAEARHNQLYQNNVWLLDDKFMTYTTVLSDKTLQNLINEILTEEELTQDKLSRPDIAIVFNGNPEQEKVDVVVVEIKPRYDKLHENEKAIGQIQKRARNLLKYYPHHIQRLWFYAVVDVNEEFSDYLISNGYREMFSTGTSYTRYQEIAFRDNNNNRLQTPVNITVLPYTTMIDDAQARNDTFLNILKATIKEQTQ